MSLCKEGFPAITFGATLAGVWESETGFDWEGIVREVIDKTSTVDANRKKLAGRLRDYGQMTMTVFVDTEIDYDSFIDTEDTLTITMPITNVVNTTASVISDEASIVGFKPIWAENTILKAELTIMFTGTAFVWTPESV